MNYNYDYDYNNVINYPYIDYIIKCYVPELQYDENKSKKVNMELFEESMMHPSMQYLDDYKTYDRLEYLGDAIFHMITTEYFYKRFREDNEGFLTRLRIRVERGDSMADLTRKLELDQFIQLNGIILNDHILEDVFEAFIGAFYLNFGIKYTRLFIINLIERYKDLSELIAYDDNYKDMLLRYFHQMRWGHPKYKEVITGKNKFESSICNPFGKILGVGISYTKKKAEQLASRKALESLGVIIKGELDVDWIKKIDKIDRQAKEKDKTDKKPLPVFNPKNKLLKKTDIKNILLNYNVILNNDINIKLFHEAMTHRSYLIRKNMSPEEKSFSKNCVKLQKKSNERLQFLGDSVIHFVVGESLYHKYRSSDEGFLTRLRCKLENRDSLFYLAKQTDISNYLLISQTIEVLHGRNNINIIGGGFEAFIGALYLETGLQIAKQFILEVIRVELDLDKIAENETNYKDLVLQLYNKNHWGHPIYKLLSEKGPDHKKKFTMGIYLNNKLVGKGTAYSKKKAEQIASKKMYHKYIND
ncbi:ribonuclease III [Acanthamoeba polyphaga moumouvirus]|uniref:Ribonuclease III n=2 Tax=Moumouvirus TaxID=3080801 RepID=L7RCJ8_9VIRU|nr:ribonuclease III [Acanthamoeba polyphaga moumouvirus]AGC02017.1 ribonuclease III [Acanthamoeba polyphaga moumouvirus]AQN68385.1 ribonuclease III [Saudi moumouvirus]